jgi:hypothetical protein
VTVAVRPPPPARTVEHAGGGSGWVELTTAKDAIDAHLIAGKLGAADIDSRMVPDRTSPGAWLYGGSNPWAPVTIMVRSFQLIDATILLAEISLRDSAEGAMSAAAPKSSALWWFLAAALGTAVTLLQMSRWLP